MRRGKDRTIGRDHKKGGGKIVLWDWVQRGFRDSPGIGNVVEREGEKKWGERVGSNG